MLCCVAATAWPSTYKKRVRRSRGYDCMPQARPICPYKQGEAPVKATPLCISDRYLTTFKVKQRPPKQVNFQNGVSYPFREFEESGKLGTAKIFRRRGECGARWSTRVTLLIMTQPFPCPAAGCLVKVRARPARWCLVSLPHGNTETQKRGNTDICSKIV